MLKIWTQGLLNWTQDLNLGIWEKPWVGIHCARNRQTTQDRQGTIKYLDTLAMRKNRQVSCEDFLSLQILGRAGAKLLSRSDGRLTGRAARGLLRS